MSLVGEDQSLRLMVSECAAQTSSEPKKAGRQALVQVIKARHSQCQVTHLLPNFVTTIAEPA